MGHLTIQGYGGNEQEDWSASKAPLFCMLCTVVKQGGNYTAVLVGELKKKGRKWEGRKEAW